MFSMLCTVSLFHHAVSPQLTTTLFMSVSDLRLVSVRLKFIIE